MRRLFVPFLVLAAAAIPARAFDGPTCGGVWSVSTPSSRACVFTLAGLPITIEGEATATTDAEIRIWVHPEGYPELVLAECTDGGGTRASCSARLDQASLILPQQFPHTLLRCNVSGRSAGTFRCESNHL